MRSQLISEEPESPSSSPPLRQQLYSSSYPDRRNSLRQRQSSFHQPYADYSHSFHFDSQLPPESSPMSHHSDPLFDYWNHPDTSPLMSSSHPSENNPYPCNSPPSYNYYSNQQLNLPCSPNQRNFSLPSLMHPHILSSVSTSLFSTSAPAANSFLSENDNTDSSVSFPLLNSNRDASSRTYSLPPPAMTPLTSPPSSPIQNYSFSFNSDNRNISPPPGVLSLQKRNAALGSSRHSFSGDRPLMASSHSRIPAPIPEPDNIGPFFCSWHGVQSNPCSEVFLDSETLFQHVYSLHCPKLPPKYKYFCGWNGCEKVFQRRDHLISHVKTHIPYRPFLCDICGKTFKWSHDRNAHRRRKHFVTTPMSTPAQSPVVTPSNPSIQSEVMKQIKRNLTTVTSPRPYPLVAPDMNGTFDGPAK